MSPAVPFVKASACGNDFLIIEGVHAPADLADFTRRACDRHNGVGADGVEWLLPAGDADIEARLLNADGSPAEISGNGTRCVAAYLASQQERKTITVKTGAGVKTCTLMSRHYMSFEFEAAMGKPQVGKEFSLRVASGDVTGIPVSMGNPHFVILVSKFPARWQALATEIATSGHFKEGVNVELARVQNTESIEILLFERGVGETQSSGTGSCASAVAAIASRGVQSPVHVKAPGGAQVVRWEGEVYLRGPAQIVCRGEFFV